MLRHILIGCLIFAGALEAVPKRYITKAEKNRSVTDELHGLIDDVRYETSNHEAELRMFEEKLNNQELALDSLWKQFNDSAMQNKEKLRDAIKGVEERLANVDSKAGSAVSDLQKLRSHANSSSDVIEQYKQKIAHMEKAMDVMEQNLEHMYTAVKSMMDALQIRDVALNIEKPSDAVEAMVYGTSVYRVKAGDSLEKIARRHHTSVQKLKELNRLNENNDLIIVGQSLKIPGS